MSLDNQIEKLPRTSSITTSKCRAIGIETFWDLLDYFPTRYQNNSLPTPIRDIMQDQSLELRVFETADSNNIYRTVKGTVEHVQNVYTRNGKKIQKVLVSDDSGKIELTWFNQPYIVSMLHIGQTIQAVGKVAFSKDNVQLYVNDFEVLVDSTTPLHTHTLVPIYSEKHGLSTKTIREKIHLVLSSYADFIDELLPEEVVKNYDLLSSKQAYLLIHKPENEESIALARKRLGFDELLVVQYATQKIKKEWSGDIIEKQFSLTSQLSEKLATFIQKLPFKLTLDQETAYNQIISDMSKNRAMNRLLLGEVGSGKTVVAAIACLFTHLNNHKTFIMAPTEILAEQHYNTIQSLLGSQVLVQLVTSSIKKGDTNASISVGTHSLISKKMEFDNVGLVVVDEQQKFGVAQRAELKKKAVVPHLLTMTATPIPRTVLLSWYGYLSTSHIRQLPHSRIPIKSYVVPKIKREKAYIWIAKILVENKSQAFIVCPLIDESEHESLKNVKAVAQEFEKIKLLFPQFSVGLLHGKLKTADKQKIMSDFEEKRIDILVSTPVVEVGIDFPNATIIVIEASERYGLSQLHQLRGRVGRGTKQSYCLLFTEKVDELIEKRLQFFASHKSGEDLAEYDLKHRGAGEIFGTKQHGFADLKIAQMSDMNLLSITKSAATQLLEKNTPLHPRIMKKVHALLTSSISPD